MLLALFEIWSDRSLLEQHLVVYNIYPLEKKKNKYYICTVQDLTGAMSLVLVFHISSNN